MEKSFRGGLYEIGIASIDRIKRVQGIARKCHRWRFYSLNSCGDAAPVKT
jgi:hypothetical protein